MLSCFGFIIYLHQTQIVMLISLIKNYIYHFIVDIPSKHCYWIWEIWCAICIYNIINFVFTYYSTYDWIFFRKSWNFWILLLFCILTNLILFVINWVQIFIVNIKENLNLCNWIYLTNHIYFHIYLKYCICWDGAMDRIWEKWTVYNLLNWNFWIWI